MGRKIYDNNGKLLSRCSVCGVIMVATEKRRLGAKCAACCRDYSLIVQNLKNYKNIAQSIARYGEIISILAQLNPNETATANLQRICGKGKRHGVK